MASARITQTCTNVNSAGTHYYERTYLLLDEYSIVGQPIFMGTDNNNFDTWRIQVTPVQGAGITSPYIDSALTPINNNPWGVHVTLTDINNTHLDERGETLHSQAKPCR